MTGKCQPSLRRQRPSRSRGQPAMGWHLTTARLRRPSSGRGGKEEEGTRGDGGSWHQQCPIQQDCYKVARSMARFAAQTQRPPHHPAEGGVQGYGSAPPPHGQMGLSPANCRKVMTACVHIRKKKIAFLASGRTRRSGRFRRNLLNSDADRHGTVRPDAVRHGICLPDGAWQGIFVLDARCQGIFLLDAAVSGHFLSGRSRVRANGIRTTRVMAPWLRWLSRHGTSQQILASHSQTRSGFQA